MATFLNGTALTRSIGYAFVSLTNPLLTEPKTSKFLAL